MNKCRGTWKKRLIAEIRDSIDSIMVHRWPNLKTSRQGNIINYHFLLHAFIQLHNPYAIFLITTSLECSAKSLKLHSAYYLTVLFLRPIHAASRICYEILRDNLITSNFCLFLFCHLLVAVAPLAPHFLLVVCHVFAILLPAQFHAFLLSCNFLWKFSIPSFAQPGRIMRDFNLDFFFN